MIILPTKEQWEVLRELGIVGGYAGNVIISPDVQEALREEGIDPTSGDSSDYDFGGDPDMVMDIVTSTKHYALNNIFRREE